MASNLSWLEVSAFMVFNNKRQGRKLPTGRTGDFRRQWLFPREQNEVVQMDEPVKCVLQPEKGIFVIAQCNFCHGPMSIISPIFPFQHGVPVVINLCPLSYYILAMLWLDHFPFSLETTRSREDCLFGRMGGRCSEETACFLLVLRYLHLVSL